LSGPAPAHLFVSGRNAPQFQPGHRNLHQLDDHNLLRELDARYGSSSALLDDPELRALFLPILRADLEVVETYTGTPAPQLDCPLSACAGSDDPSVSPEGLAAWSATTSGAFNLRHCSGDHFYHLGAGQQTLLQHITQQLQLLP
jgi:surfactin synthase thioesterase subunit